MIPRLLVALLSAYRQAMLDFDSLLPPFFFIHLVSRPGRDKLTEKDGGSAAQTICSLSKRVNEGTEHLGPSYTQ